MKSEDYKHQFSAWAQLTEQRLAELCDAYLPAQSELGQAARYSLLDGGKRFIRGGQRAGIIFDLLPL